MRSVALSPWPSPREALKAEAANGSPNDDGETGEGRRRKMKSVGMRVAENSLGSAGSSGCSKGVQSGKEAERV